MGRVKVACEGYSRFWLFFSPEHTVADLENQARESLELDAATPFKFWLDGCEVLRKTPCAIFNPEDVLHLQILSASKPAAIGPQAFPATSTSAAIEVELAENTEDELPLPPAPKRRKLAYDTTRLLEYALPSDMPADEVVMPRVYAAPQQTTEQEHLQITNALMNGTLPEEEEASDGDFRPGFDGSGSDSGDSDMDVTSEEDEPGLVLPVHRSSALAQNGGLGQGALASQSLRQALTDPQVLASAMQAQAASTETQPGELVQPETAKSPVYHPPSPNIRVATPPPATAGQGAIVLPPQASSSNPLKVSSSSSSPTSSDSDSSSSNSSSSSSSSSDSSSSDEADASTILKPSAPRPQPVNRQTAKKPLAGAVKATPPGEGLSRTTKRNARRRNAKKLKQALLGGNAPNEAPNDELSRAKAAALSVMDRVAQEDAKEDASSSTQTKVKQKSQQKKADAAATGVLSQNDLARQLQTHRNAGQAVVPPSQKELPSNVFVTSIDVERPEVEEEEEKQLESREQALVNGNGIMETEEMEAEPEAQQEEWHGWEDWPSLDDVSERWRHLQKVLEPSAVKEGSKIAFQILELSVESFTPEFVLYYGQVTYVPPPVTSADPNLLPTMTGQDQSLKSEWSVTVALHPEAIRPDDEVGDEREYSWNDLADVRVLA